VISSWSTICRELRRFAASIIRKALQQALMLVEAVRPARDTSSRRRRFAVQRSAKLVRTPVATKSNPRALQRCGGGGIANRQHAPSLEAC